MTSDHRPRFEDPESGAPMYAPDKEEQALEALSTSVGIKWYEAKHRAMDTEDKA